jgi:hypothetical protein
MITYRLGTKDDNQQLIELTAASGMLERPLCELTVTRTFLNYWKNAEKAKYLLRWMKIRLSAPFVFQFSRHMQAAKSFLCIISAILK